MKIKIGEAVSISTPESFKITTDDRQTLIQTDGGNIVQDYGHIASGDKINLQATFHRDNFILVWNYFQNRTFITFIDPSGITWQNMRVKVISYGYYQRFEDYITAELELWTI